MLVEDNEKQTTISVFHCLSLYVCLSLCVCVDLYEQISRLLNSCSFNSRVREINNSSRGVAKRISSSKLNLISGGGKQGFRQQYH